MAVERSCPILRCVLADSRRLLLYPYFLDIGYLYADLVEDVSKADDIDTFGKTIYEVFTSFFYTKISNYDTSLYDSGWEYLKCCYEDGKLLPWWHPPKNTYNKRK